MNIIFSRFRYTALVFLALLPACSGGGVDISVNGPIIPNLPPLPPPSSEALTAHGKITGLANLTVNDVSYGTSNATVTTNGMPGTFSDLRRGQVITVVGRIYSGGQTGTATRLDYHANIIGPVESLDAANGRLTVMGQTVAIDADTQFGAGIDPTTLAGLVSGDNIEVSGFADAGDIVIASRLDLDTTSSELQLIGKVSSLDTANLVFAINRLTVDYSGASLIDLPNGAPSNGMTLRAIGNMSDGLFSVTRLVRAPTPTGGTNQRAQVAGVITRFNSATDFDINGTDAATHPGTTFANGNASDLALNAAIVIDGKFTSGGRISANRITFGDLTSTTSTLAYAFTDFTAISVPTVFNVIVNQGQEFKVEVQVDQDAAQRVQVTQTGVTLNIELLPGNGHIRTLDAYVTMPLLERIDLTGVVNATLSDFNQAQMTVNVGGVSRLYGHALTIGNLTASVSGVSQLAFGDIRPIGYADIDISGVSQATLNMNIGTTLTGSVSTGQGTGVSTLFYYGTDVDVNVTRGFISSVVKLGETRP